MQNIRQLKFLKRLCFISLQTESVIWSVRKQDVSLSSVRRRSAFLNILTNSPRGFFTWFNNKSKRPVHPCVGGEKTHKLKGAPAFFLFHALKTEDDFIYFTHNKGSVFSLYGRDMTHEQQPVNC